MNIHVPSSTGEERLDCVRISRRSDPGVFVANFPVIPQLGQLSVCSAHFKPGRSLTTTTVKFLNIVHIV